MLAQAARKLLAAYDRLEEAKSDVRVISVQDLETGDLRKVTQSDVLAARLMVLNPLIEEVKAGIEGLREALDVVNDS